MGTRFADPLAHADPFELAQAIAAAVGAAPAEALRAEIARACKQGGAYRAELEELLDPQLGEDELKRRLTAFFRSNLRAIRFFGPSFAREVEARLPAGAVGMDTEPGPGNRTLRATFAGVGAVALAAVLLGGAGALKQFHAASTAAQATTGGLAQVTIPPRRPHKQRALPASASPSSSPRPTASASAVPSAPPSASPQPVPTPTTLPPDPTPVAPENPPRPTPPASPPPPGRGAVAVVIRATPTPTPRAISVSDLPRVYSDATPLPAASLAPAVAPEHPRVPRVTPTPSPPPRHSWLTRAALHLDPFKPH